MPTIAQGSDEMESKIDWSKAPADATHYFPPTEVWYLAGNGCAPLVWNGMWIKAFQFSQREHKCVQRPTTPSWSCEGLPPVGADVEVKHELYGWIGARVVGQDGAAAIVRTNDGYAGVFPHQMRPIRTPEQIAADEREAAIDAMWSHYLQPILAPSQKNQVITALGLMYDAGFRKP